MLLPIDFAYPVFAAILLLNGISMGMFASPNRAAVMNSLPAGDRGAGGGMNQTFQNSAQVLSIGIFFTLMIVGLWRRACRSTLSGGLQAHGVSPAAAHQAGQTPPISVLFAAFLGYNPIQHLVGGARARRAVRRSSTPSLTGSAFFPHLISAPFSDGLHAAFIFAIVACLVAAARIAAPRRPLPPRRGAGARPARPRTSRNWRSSMRVEWHGQSAFTLTRQRGEGLHRPLRRHVRLAERGISSSTRPSRWTPSTCC